MSHRIRPLKQREKSRNLRSIVCSFVRLPSDFFGSIASVVLPKQQAIVLSREAFIKERREENDEEKKKKVSSMTTTTKKTRREKSKEDDEEKSSSSSFCLSDVLRLDYNATYSNCMFSSFIPSFFLLDFSLSYFHSFLWCRLLFFYE